MAVRHAVSLEERARPRWIGRWRPGGARGGFIGDDRKDVGWGRDARDGGWEVVEKGLGACGCMEVWGCGELWAAWDRIGG